MRNDNQGRRDNSGHEQRPKTNYAAMTDYFDDKGRLKKDVFTAWPNTIAENLNVSRTNLRRAYDCVAAMRFRILAGKEDPHKIVQEGMGQLHRFVQYQAGREKTWEEAKNFFHAHCNAVGNDPKKFEGFYQLFQSVMAYLRR
jgi:CRISPR type III-A-associated protein Csm2